MADILKVTAPLLSKNTILPKQPTDPTIPFTLHDISKAVKTSAQSELLGQNNELLQKDDSASILMNLLKDPSVTMQFLKNIFMMEEIVNLLSVNNKAFTQEIEQLFQALLIPPDQIAAEMKQQEYASTSFKGALFDFLRGVLAKNPDYRGEVASLLKAINTVLARQDVLDSVANSLNFLGDKLSASPGLSQKLLALAGRFRSEDAAVQFESLKGETLALLGEVENSILYSPRLAKVVPLLFYNLSRFNDNPEFLKQAIGDMMFLMDSKEEKALFRQLITEYLKELGTKDGKDTGKSRVMDTLAKIIGKEMGETALLAGDKADKIIHSLLSSPCNFTPLLHFVLPVEYMNTRAFAELWIDPNDIDLGSPTLERGIHMLIVFELDGIGQVEAEFWVQGDSIRFALFCPGEYYEEFSALKNVLSQTVNSSRYKFEQITVDRLKHPRSLMDVFKTLPYKRTGVDVKV